MTALPIHALQLVAAVILIRSSAHGIPLEDFYSFGAVTGDAFLPPNDDGFSSPINLPNPFPFFDEVYSTIFVNNNGLLSFLQGVSQFTPEAFPLTGGQKLIAPFWADVDTGGTGTVWFRTTTDSGLLARARDEVTAFFDQDDFSPAYLFVATWDHVGYYSSRTDKTNTFQCVLATDGLKSFAFFLYADGEIQWTTGDASSGSGGFGGTPAHAGFDAGDGVRFALIPESDSPEIINIDTTSNVGVPGVWAFRVDGEDIAVGVCSDVDDTKVNIAPQLVRHQGGAAVLVSGPCFEEDDQISCVFDGVAVEGIYVTEDTSLCISPPLPSFGRLPFQLNVMTARGTIKYQGDSVFFSLEPDNENADVDFDYPSPLLLPDESFGVTWDPEDILPLPVIDDPLSFTVDIVLYEFNLDTGLWEELQDLATDVPNTGERQVTIQAIEDNSLELPDVCPVAIAVVVSGESTSLSPTSKRGIGLSALIQRAVGTVKRWARQAYTIVFEAVTEVLSLTERAIGILLRELCESWCNGQPPNIGQEILDRLPPCPPDVQRALSDPQFKLDNRLISFFHPSATSCYRQETITSENQGSGQQCCYSRTGELIVGSDSGGTVDLYSPQFGLPFIKHQLHDVLPYFYCCVGLFRDCSAYYQKRPSSDGTGYQLQVPACVYGDPHIVTTDGLKYTFNGKGEFTLIETTSNSFTLQGRMVEVTNEAGSPTAATVFSAIVGKQNDSDTVQLELSRRGVDALVNGERVDFEVMSIQNFNNVVVSNLGNRTVAALFSSGAYIEAKEENGIISVLLINLPSSLKGTTRGLMGTYNGDTSDDLVPKSAAEPIPANSSLRDIHAAFGMTWIIENSTESLFTYKPGESWATFYSPAFTPTYEAVFSDPAQEAEAMMICGDDQFCLFDIAATGNTDIGRSTQEGGQNFEIIVQLSAPVVCNPPCENGACVANDTCNCAEGFKGDKCDEKVVTECDGNRTTFCKNGGVCIQHVQSYTCECPSDYTGIFCEEALEEEDSATSYLIVGVASAGGTAVVLLLSILCIAICYCTCNKGRYTSKKENIDISMKDLSDC